MNYVPIWWLMQHFSFSFTGFDVFLAFPLFFLFQHTYTTHTAELSVTHFNLCSLKWKSKAWSLLCAVTWLGSQNNWTATQGAQTLWEWKGKRDQLFLCQSLLFFWICVRPKIKKQHSKVTSTRGWPHIRWPWQTIEGKLDYFEALPLKQGIL